MTALLRCYARCSAALALLAIASCGSDQGSSPPDASLAVATISNRALTRALGGEPATLDPRLAEDNAALALLQDLYEGLTAEAADGNIIPGAAQSWSVSEDGRTWTFRLRENLRWSDGTPLTAAQFVAGLDAARVEGSQAPYSALLHEVTYTRATDSRTVVLEVTRAVPYLPAVLALPVAAPQHLATSAGASIIGNGPYRLLRRRPGEKIELERNPHYHSAGAVAIERVTYLTLEDLNTELNLYRSGELDVTSEVPNTQVSWLQQNLPGELHIAPYLSTYGFAFNLARMRDRDARVALSMAVDRGQITRQVTGAGMLIASAPSPVGAQTDKPAATNKRAGTVDAGQLPEAKQTTLGPNRDCWPRIRSSWSSGTPRSTWAAPSGTAATMMRSPGRAPRRRLRPRRQRFR